MVVVSSCREVFGQFRQRAKPLFFFANRIKKVRTRKNFDKWSQKKGGLWQIITVRYWAGLHTCHNGYNNKMRLEQSGANLQKFPQYRSFSEIRECEEGITSNRGSEHRGEYVLEYRTHCPSRLESWFAWSWVKVGALKRRFSRFLDVCELIIQAKS